MQLVRKMSTLLLVFLFLLASMVPTTFAKTEPTDVDDIALLKEFYILTEDEEGLESLSELDSEIYSLRSEDDGKYIQTQIKFFTVTEEDGEYLMQPLEEALEEIKEERNRVSPDDFAANRVDMIGLRMGNYVEGKRIYYDAWLDYYKGEKPSSVDIDGSIQNATSRYNTSYDTITKIRGVARYKEKVTASAPINGTYYWRGNATGEVVYKDGTPNSATVSLSPILLNKKGEPYPEYDGLDEPEKTNWKKVDKSKRVPWTNKERNEYKDWYWNNVDANFDFDGYEIHHIRPRAYGGKNDPSNLIPLPRKFHRGEVSPWFSNYGSDSDPCDDEVTE